MCSIFSLTALIETWKNQGHYVMTMLSDDPDVVEVKQKGNNVNTDSDINIKGMEHVPIIFYVTR